MLRRHLFASAAFAPDAGGAASGVTAAAAVTPSFHESLPAEYRTDPAFKDIKDVAGLAKSYHHAQKLIGRPADQVVALPGPDDADGWKNVWQRLGRPEAADKYELPTPQGVQEDPKFKQAFATKAHEAGLSTKQARALFDWYNAEAQAADQAAGTQATQRQADAVAKLKTEWGAAYDRNLAEARSALAHYGDAELVAWLNEAGRGDDPRLLRVFAKLGRQLSEDGLIGRGAGGDDIAAPDDAKRQIRTLQADKQFMAAYHDKRAPGHDDAVKRMTRLYEQAHPQT